MVSAPYERIPILPELEALSLLVPKLHIVMKSDLKSLTCYI